MGRETKLVKKWINDFGIHLVMDAEEFTPSSPQTEGWDLSKTWTCWDSYDQMGSFVTPGFSEKEEVEGELFVSAWYLGTQPANETEENVTVMDRDVCEECDTEGCETCEDLGWVETDYLEGTNIQFVALFPETKQTSKPAKFCSNCGQALGGPFCSSCGQRVVTV